MVQINAITSDPPSLGSQAHHACHGRSATMPPPVALVKNHVKKRIIVCCDGTWQDGVQDTKKWMYTNVLRLARTINHDDDRHQPPIPQVVFYQTGIGSEGNIYAKYVEGTTGFGLSEKVQEAYAFIAHNYQPGDEIFLFGFSRGAYTARMVAVFIGEIGVLNRTDMDAFADIFLAYQKLQKAKDKAEIDAQNKILAPWNQHDSPGKKRADSDDKTFSVKCVGVFDTVGSLGLPEELTAHSEAIRTVFGFSDRLLGEHIERAYHALAINETRADFNCCKFQQTPAGRRKDQILKQCWFSGSHADIGGGWESHDLADLTLAWMAANIGDILSIDMQYLASLPNPVAPWGSQCPHDPRTGIYKLSDSIRRTLPTATDDVTHETIHPSVLCQMALSPVLQVHIQEYPALITALLPLEEEVKVAWDYSPKQASEQKAYQIAQEGGAVKEDGMMSILSEIVTKVEKVSKVEVSTIVVGTGASDAAVKSAMRMGG